MLDGKVYAVGGFNGCLRIRTVDLYDPQADSWQACVNMEVRRSTLGVAVLNDCIYAVRVTVSASGALGRRGERERGGRE